MLRLREARTQQLLARLKQAHRRHLSAAEEGDEAFSLRQLADLRDAFDACESAEGLGRGTLSLDGARAMMRALGCYSIVRDGLRLRGNRAAESLFSGGEGGTPRASIVASPRALGAGGGADAAVYLEDLLDMLQERDDVVVPLQWRQWAAAAAVRAHER